MSTPQALRAASPPLPAPLGCDPQQLVGLARAGDWRALDAASRCFGQHLLAAGRRHCRTESEAEDALQDALLAAGQHLDQFRGDGTLEGWLMRLVIHACRRLRRGRKNDPALHVAGEPNAPGDDPESLASEKELAATLTRALMALSPDERTLLLLAEAEGYRAPELALQLHASPAAIRKRLQRARTKLRAALGPTPLGGGVDAPRT